MYTVAFWLKGIDGLEPEGERLPLAHVEFVSQHQIGLNEYSYPRPAAATARREVPVGWSHGWLYLP